MMKSSGFPLGETHIYPKKKKIFICLIGAIGLEILWVTFIVLLLDSEMTVFETLILIMFVSFCVFFGLGVLLILRTLFLKTPLFVLSEHGIIDHSQKKNGLFIPWSDMTAISTAPNESVSITVKDPTLLNRRLNPIQRFFLLFGSWVLTNQPHLNCSLSTHSAIEVYNLIILYSEEYHRT